MVVQCRDYWSFDVGFGGRILGLMEQGWKLPLLIMGDHTEERCVMRDILHSVSCLV